MPNKHGNLIITAASESYRPQLLSMLASLRCNWPDHPQVLVYGIDLSEETFELVRQAGFEARAIPQFVPHWRKHYTWKFWCMNDAPAERVLWLDAGVFVLRPLPEIFDIVVKQGYFALPNHQRLEIEASEQACEGCGVPAEFRAGKVTVTSAVFGFLRGSPIEQVVQECLRVARTERFIAATKPEHRWEQAILSLLLYRDISPLILCDGSLYFCEDLRAKFTAQSIWAARRFMHYKDQRFLATCMVGPVSPFIPRSSHKVTWWFQGALRIRNALRTIKRLLTGTQSQTLNRHVPMDGVVR
ncbi:MAG: hypothetical protein ABSG96_08035 [Terracidiphilus sp.]|jgi:hypothetical protein